MGDFRFITDGPMVMGEGPLWDPEGQRLYWIDVMRPTVHSSTVDGSEPRSAAFPRRSISALALRSDGGAVVASSRGVYLFDLETLEAEKIFDVAPDFDGGLNDCTVDRQGRFVTGMADGSLIRALTKGETGLEPTGNLYRIDSDLSAHVIGDPIGVTNGPCFDRAGTTFYCNDSAARRIWAWDYEPATGATANRRLIAQFDEPHAIPDGATVDDEGYLWVAIYHGGEVRRYAPDGTLDLRIPTPVSCPTSVAFAGPELDVLVVTSRGPQEDGSGTANDGRVLTVHGLGVRGVPETRFAAS